MANSTQDSPDKVSLEELLRFKRAERPDQAFWEQFDHELHQRMLQTLVKKDPWYVQVLRGLTGKIAQTGAVAAAAAVLALMAIRPALVVSDEPSKSSPAKSSPAALAEAPHEPAAQTKPAEAKMSSSESPVLVAQADYRIESVTTSTGEGSNGVTKDFGLDHINVASYDNSVYTADMALPGFASTGVASIVY